MVICGHGNNPVTAFFESGGKEKYGSNKTNCFASE